VVTFAYDIEHLSSMCSISICYGTWTLFDSCPEEVKWYVLKWGFQRVLISE